MARTKAKIDRQCFLSLLLLQACYLQFADSLSVVKHLPGFPGTLPFYLETGYIGVDESEDVQLFYYFVKSERDPTKDPLLLWLNGGPGCSALSGLIYEIGPFTFKEAEYSGSFPSLILRQGSWTKVASIIFVDMPVGTGFSFARTPLASESSDSIQIRRADQFLRKWLMDHPEFYSNPFYIGGDSYSGITVPAIAQRISIDNGEGVKPLINLKGYICGNPLTDPITEENSKIPYAHGMGLISDELYESLESSCGGQYQIVDPSNVECLKYLQAFHEITSGLNSGNILEPICDISSPHPIRLFDERRSLGDKSQESHLSGTTLPCRLLQYPLSVHWANDNNVRKALHIQEGSIGQWKRCNYEINYTSDIYSSTKYHAYLSAKGYRSLIYSGDHDMVVPFLGTKAWIKALNYPIVDDWRPWKVQGQVAGYTRTYSNNMTYATVKGGGHTAPEYRPVECLAMFERWILLQEPL